MLKINDHVLVKNELLNKDQREYTILGSKDKPFACHIDTIHDYFVYPPGNNHFILEDCSIKKHTISDLIFVKENDIIPCIKTL